MYKLIVARGGSGAKIVQGANGGIRMEEIGHPKVRRDGCHAKGAALPDTYL
jgi:hypothetical protein